MESRLVKSSLRLSSLFIILIAFSAHSQNNSLIKLRYHNSDCDTFCYKCGGRYKLTLGEDSTYTSTYKYSNLWKFSSYHQNKVEYGFLALQYDSLRQPLNFLNTELCKPTEENAEYIFSFRFNNYSKKTARRVKIDCFLSEEPDTTTIKFKGKKLTKYCNKNGVFKFPVQSEKPAYYLTMLVKGPLFYYTLQFDSLILISDDDEGCSTVFMAKNTKCDDIKCVTTVKLPSSSTIPIHALVDSVLLQMDRQSFNSIEIRAIDDNQNLSCSQKAMETSLEIYQELLKSKLCVDNGINIVNNYDPGLYNLGTCNQAYLIKIQFTFDTNINWMKIE